MVVVTGEQATIIYQGLQGDYCIMAKEKGPIGLVGENDSVEQATIQPKAASPASSFKATEYVPIDGGARWVKIRRVDLTTLVRGGKIPNPLLTAAYKIAEGDDGAPKPDEEQTDEEADLAKDAHYAALDVMAQAVVLEPTLVLTEEEETDDNVWVGRIAPADKRVLLMFAWLEVKHLDNFRRRLTGASPIPDGGEVRPDADFLSP